MRAFGLYCSIGIGDIIITNNILENEKYKFSKIYVNPLWSLIDKYKNGKHEYRNFVNSLMGLLFKDPIYVLNHGGNFKHISTPQMVYEHGLKLTKPYLEPVLCKGDFSIEEPFVVVTTKVRELNIGYYNIIRNGFIDAIKNLSLRYKIIILGEKEVEMNGEYIIHTQNNVYSIYNDIINNVSNCIDLTVPKLGLEIPNLGKIMNDCLIMNKAKAVIVIGIGGNFVLASSVSKKLISYCHDPYGLVCKMHPGNDFSNAVTFINEINSL